MSQCAYLTALVLVITLAALQMDFFKFYVASMRGFDVLRDISIHPFYDSTQVHALTRSRAAMEQNCEMADAFQDAVDKLKENVKALLTENEPSSSPGTGKRIHHWRIFTNTEDFANVDKASRDLRQQCIVSFQHLWTGYNMLSKVESVAKTDLLRPGRILLEDLFVSLFAPIAIRFVALLLIGDDTLTGQVKDSVENSMIGRMQYWEEVFSGNKEANSEADPL